VSLSANDRLDILQVLAQADSAATRRDAEGYVAFFSDDAVLDGEKGEHRGKELLRRSVGPIWASEGPSSVHLTLNAIVEDLDDRPDRAVATSVLLILTGNAPASVHSVSAIVQHLIKVGAEWKIERRTVGPVT
jgi:ketosteroid isomerase-like protein